MHVFVLGTGRSGTTTFTEACHHITNFTAAHETHTHTHPNDRLDFPDNHIEVDNRLSWFLGELYARYGEDAMYVHLRRDVDATARSFEKLWNSPVEIPEWAARPSRRAFARLTVTRKMPLPVEHAAPRAYRIIEAYAHSIVMKSRWPDEDRFSVCQAYVRTVQANVDLFVRDRRHAMTLDIEHLSEQFPAFWEAIGARGALDTAIAETRVQHNTLDQAVREGRLKL